MVEKQLPSNCLRCRNSQVKRKNDGFFCIGCSVNNTMITTDAQRLGTTLVEPPVWCPLQQEEQPWGEYSIIRGSILIKIEGVGEFGSVNESIVLLERACSVYVVITGQPVRVIAEPLELVSSDPVSRTAVFRKKPLPS